MFFLANVDIRYAFQLSMVFCLSRHGV